MSDEKDVFKKPENVFKPGEMSIKTDKNEPKLKNPIEITKSEDKKKERENKSKLEKEKNKKKLFEKYRKVNKIKDDEKQKKKDDEKKLRKLYIKYLRKENKMAKKNKRESFTLLFQKGKLNPENLINLNAVYPNMQYEIDLDDFDEEAYEEEDAEEEIQSKEEKEKEDFKMGIQKNINKSVWKYKLQQQVDFLKNASDIPEKYHFVIALLNINIPKFYKFEKMFKMLETQANEFRKRDAEENKEMQNDYMRKSIVEYMYFNLRNRNISMTSFKEYLNNYYTFIKENINANASKNQENRVDELGYFILMYETFVKNNFWMIFPEENKEFFTFIILRIFQTLDEGIDTVIKNYDKNKELDEPIDPYNRINNDEERNKFENIKFLKIVEKKIDKDPYCFHRYIRNMWYVNSEKVGPNNKRLFMISAARHGMVQFLLLCSLSLLEKELSNLSFYDISKKENQGKTKLMTYLLTNRKIITYFLTTQINIITKDSNISNSDKLDKFFKYLWKEYEMINDL
tara:strand:+ start:2514 stop:4055 length:1542 start_codon:yes stop_codon:yes gene_type:complete